MPSETYEIYLSKSRRVMINSCENEVFICTEDKVAPGIWLRNGAIGRFTNEQAKQVAETILDACTK